MASQNLNTEKSSSPISGDAVEQKKRADVDRPVRKKKEIRRERFEQKCRDRGIDIEEAKRKRQEKVRIQSSLIFLKIHKVFT